MPLRSLGMAAGEMKELSQLNEEGLPIVEIIEPVDDLDTPSLTAATDEYAEDHDPEPLSNLSPEALALNRQRRDKILQVLEEEEEREKRRTEEERRLELQRQREFARKQMETRMLNQGFEIERRRKANEVELRMAKALVKSGGTESRSTTTDTRKKTVTFAEPYHDSSKPTSQLPLSFPKQPMKMVVIEREPVSMPVAEGPSSGGQPMIESSRTIKFMDSAQDSDDELEPEDDTNSTASMESFDEDIVLSAKMHRELALEYHTRREALASQAVDLLSEEKVIKEDRDREDVPLEATLAQRPPKPSASRFKETRIKEKTSMEPESTTFGTAVLSPETLSNSVRMGKLVDGQLVASPLDEEKVDEETEEEEAIRKLLLQSMEQYAGIASQVMGPGPSSNGSYWAQSEDSNALATDSKLKGQVGVKSRPKESHFKHNRAQNRRSNAKDDAVKSSVKAGPELSETAEKLLMSNSISTSRPAPTIIDSPSFLGNNVSAIMTSPFVSTVVNPSSGTGAPAVTLEPDRPSTRGPVGDVLERNPTAAETHLESNRKSKKPSRFSAGRA